MKPESPWRWSILGKRRCVYNADMENEKLISRFFLLSMDSRMEIRFFEVCLEALTFDFLRTDIQRGIGTISPSIQMNIRLQDFKQKPERSEWWKVNHILESIPSHMRHWDAEYRMKSTFLFFVIFPEALMGIIQSDLDIRIVSLPFFHKCEGPEVNWMKSNEMKIRHWK